jgi:hypothetical protein
VRLAYMQDVTQEFSDSTGGSHALWRGATGGELGR